MCENLDSSDINVLILGETGVGKSTLVNAIANYGNFESMHHAAKSKDMISVIPSKFSIMDENFKRKEIMFGEDENECDEHGYGSLATIDTKMYRVTYKGRSVVLIDTPGLGDTSGMKKDEKNIQILLSKIAEFKQLHAILILFKPNDSKVSMLFKNSIKQLLSSMEASASSNIVFLFTNSRGTFYNPGDTVGPLMAVLEQIRDASPYIDVPFNKNNTFCVDNEAYRFLIAKKNSISFSDDDTKQYGKSWNRSANEIWKMFKYIRGLNPHNIQDSMSINTSRALIIRLVKPLAEISQNINDNIKRLKKYMKMQDDMSLSAGTLKKNLVSIKKIGLKIHQIGHPITVCADQECVAYSKVDGVSSVSYPKVCHQRCHLKGIQKEELGDARLMDCSEMYKGSCIRSDCRHSYRHHMHIYYVSEPYEYKTKDEGAKSDIDRKMTKVDRDIANFKHEQDVILDAMTKFTHFLKHNAITSKDVYKDYILHFIDMERNLGSYADSDIIRYFENMIDEYEEKLTILERNLKEKSAQTGIKSVVSSADVMKLKDELFSLPRYGQTIKEVLEAQVAARYNEQIEITEVALPKNGKPPIGKWLKSLFEKKTKV